MDRKNKEDVRVLVIGGALLGLAIAPLIGALAILEGLTAGQTVMYFVATLIATPVVTALFGLWIAIILIAADKLLP